MITLTLQPLRADGRVLLPVGKPQTIESDYLNTRRAIVEECGERDMCLHKRSAALARCVAGERAPVAVAYTVGGGMLVGVWIGGAT